MAIPNKTPNDVTGKKTLARFLWQTEESAPTKDEKHEKDWWDKADIVGRWIVALVTAFAAGAVTFAVAIVGGKISKL